MKVPKEVSCDLCGEPIRANAPRETYSLLTTKVYHKACWRRSADYAFLLVGRAVRARVLVRQSPCCDAPDVPAGTRGTVEDVDGDDPDAVEIWVDFGAPHGAVLCTIDDLEE